MNKELSIGFRSKQERLLPIACNSSKQDKRLKEATQKLRRSLHGISISRKFELVAFDPKGEFCK